MAATYQPLLGWADSSPSEGKIFASVDTTDHTYIYGSLKLESESLIDFVDMDGTKKQLSPMLLRDLLTTTLERLEVWCGDFIRSNCRDDCIALPCSMSVEIPKASSTSSFHLPLHRFLVTIISGDQISYINRDIYFFLKFCLLLQLGYGVEITIVLSEK